MVGKTITWPEDIGWAAGSAPELSSTCLDIVTFRIWDLTDPLLWDDVLWWADHIYFEHIPAGDI